MPNLHIIIGDSNTRKSSLLRCLTGVGGGNANKNLTVSTDDGEIIVLCRLSALQENYQPIDPAAFIAYIKALHPSPTDVAFTLRVNARGAYPDAMTYINAFLTADWTITNIALLGNNACTLDSLPRGAHIARAPRSASSPTNQFARKVRRVWHWH